MKTLSITLEGETRNVATLSHERSGYGVHARPIAVEITYAATGKVEEMTASAGDRDEVFDLARRVQFALDGQRGTNSMIHDVFCELQRFMD
jgi:hypothetical protein